MYSVCNSSIMRSSSFRVTIIFSSFRLSCARVLGDRSRTERSFDGFLRFIAPRRWSTNSPCPLLSSELSARYSRSFALACSHCCRRGPRYYLRSQQKFQQNMKITCLGFHKIHKRKKSTEGPVVPTLGFKVIFYQNSL